MSDRAHLVVDDLAVGLVGSSIDIVSEVSFAVESHSTLGLVGESGCGKTTVALALLGYARAGTSITGGRVLIDGRDILAADQPGITAVRGRVVSYVPQNPSRMLSPGMPVGRQLGEMVDAHLPNADRDALVRAAWEAAQLTYTEEMTRRYPHQLSGGQQQRVAIAMALVCEPRVIVMDEPTTGLDVLTQARLLEVIADLRSARDVSIVYVSHDLGVVRNVVNRVAVMYGGRIVETGNVDELFVDPRHPYTRRLLEAIPRARLDTGWLRGIPGSAVEPWNRPRGCPFAPRCDMRVERCEQEMPPTEPVRPGSDRDVRCWRANDADRIVQMPRRARSTVGSTSDVDNVLLGVRDLVAEYRSRRQGIGKSRATNMALCGASFSVPPASCLAVVGESGSGKSTLARCLAGLHRPTSGEILFRTERLAPLAQDRPPTVRRKIQLVFQDPDSSLNPTKSIGAIVRRPLRQFLELSRTEEAARVFELLDQVHLPAGMAARFPRELSGGEKQRVAIARALAAEPDLLICDEVTSALDVAVQASILELLDELRLARSLALLFISHDLAVVRSISDHVLVLQSGEIVESAERAHLFDEPQAQYTKELLGAAPDLHPGDYPNWENESSPARRRPQAESAR